MPCVLDPCITYDARKKRKVMALNKRYAIHALFLTLLALWAAMSIYTGYFYVRLLICFLMSIVFGFFAWSLLRIRS